MKDEIKENMEIHIKLEDRAYEQIIKEILEDVKRHLDYVEATKQCSIRDNEMKVMYDYITNLQEKYEKAIEYVERVCESEKNINPYILHAPTLLNILKGEDKDE